MEAMRERIIGAVSPYVEIESPDLVEVRGLHMGVGCSAAPPVPYCGTRLKHTVGLAKSRCQHAPCLLPVVKSCFPLRNPPTAVRLPTCLALQVAVTTDVDLGAIYSGLPQAAILHSSLKQGSPATHCRLRCLSPPASQAARPRPRPAPVATQHASPPCLAPT